MDNDIAGIPQALQKSGVVTMRMRQSSFVGLYEV